MSSTLLTVGTLLRRAEDRGVHVRVLVDGAWLEGVPVGSDSMGVVLDSPAGQVLVRTEVISAVGFQRAALEGAEGAGGGEENVWAQPSAEGREDWHAEWAQIER